jgi:hypothetical protein
MRYNRSVTDDRFVQIYVHRVLMPSQKSPTVQDEYDKFNITTQEPA